MKPIDPYEAIEAAIDRLDPDRPPVHTELACRVLRNALASRPAREAAIAELVAAGKAMNVKCTEAELEMGTTQTEPVETPIELVRFRAALAAMEGNA